MYSVYTMVNKNVTIWHADLWMRKYLFIVQQTTNGLINNMRYTFFFLLIFWNPVPFVCAIPEFECWIVVWVSSWPRRDYSSLHNLFSITKRMVRLAVKGQKYCRSLKMKRIKYKNGILSSMVYPFVQHTTDFKT